MTRTKALVAVGVTSLVFLACNVEDTDSLLGGGRSGRVAGGGGGAGTSDDSGGTLLSSGATRDEDEVVDITVPDTDDAQPADGETNGFSSLGPGQSPPVVLYLNGKGATIGYGKNDSRANTSSIVKGTTTFPASSYVNDATKWARIVATVKNHFAAYNVSVVDTEPTSGTYLEAVVTSGPASLIGYGNTLGGIAPTRCGVVATSVVFVFDRNLRSDIHTAEVISHELGHSLSSSAASARCGPKARAAATTRACGARSTRRSPAATTRRRTDR